eukprot:CAMPEP_0114176520 /NCGR_PEP_ID=MMETSP0043_2-20121206/37533_1 /TAXON_ID=464988 /ORGANISM="Hemiselmis andersenii, Strain CCMP644" /LENGTH=142 /DNA_ID=CAMNT_0001274829 /DNA_START=161 /DNA_END=586 /DNA_ORIENTATION=+
MTPSNLGTSVQLHRASPPKLPATRLEPYWSCASDAVLCSCSGWGEDHNLVEGRIWRERPAWLPFYPPDPTLDAAAGGMRSESPAAWCRRRLAARGWEIGGEDGMTAHSEPGVAVVAGGWSLKMVRCGRALGACAADSCAGSP